MMKTIEIVLPEIEQVTFEVIASAEDMSPKGNASAIDDETDAEILSDIYSQLDAGNEWAWCQVEVVASWRGFTGSDYLGGCSYASKADFMEPGGYYDDMKDQAYLNLIRRIKSLA